MARAKAKAKARETSFTHMDLYIITSVMAGGNVTRPVYKLKYILGKGDVTTAALVDEFNRSLPASYHASKRDGRWTLVHDDGAVEKVYAAVARINERGYGATAGLILDELGGELALMDDYGCDWLFRILISLNCRGRVDEVCTGGPGWTVRDGWWAVGA